MRKITALLAAVLSMALLLTACANGEASRGVTKDSLYIVYDGAVYKVNEKVDRLKNALGEPSGTVAQLSCHYAANGDEYYYDYYVGEGSYPGFDDCFEDVLRVHTVPLRPGEDIICDFDCYTDRAKTDRGITVGSSWEDVRKAYGDGYTDEGDGFYTYYAGEALPDTPRIMFRIVNDKVAYFSVSAAINL